MPRHLNLYQIVQVKYHFPVIIFLFFLILLLPVIGTSVHVYLISVGCFPILNGLYIQTLQKPLYNISDLTNLDPKLNSIQNYHATL